MIRAGFVVRNKFQIRQFDTLAAAYPGADYLLCERMGLGREFSKADLEGLALPVRLINRRKAGRVAADYDVLFFQTVFPGIETIGKTPLVSVQYGLAKERHNYGEWRSLADLNLMYGPYSAAAVSHFAPSHAVGNPKFYGWGYRLTAEQKLTAKRRLGLETAKPVILYMPTYGALGSFGELAAPLAALGRDYEILIKGHHNDERTGKAWMRKARTAGHRHLFSGGHDQRLLLEAADMVISDFSGAIFDAVYAELPVLLYQDDAAGRIGIQKFDLSSLEFRERQTIGEVCTRPADLAAAIEKVLNDRQHYVDRVAGLREQLFVDVSAADAVRQATGKVDDLLNGRLPALSTPQLYVRETVQRLLCAERTSLKKPLQAWWAGYKRSLFRSKPDAS